MISVHINSDFYHFRFFMWWHMCHFSLSQIFSCNLSDYFFLFWNQRNVSIYFLPLAVSIICSWNKGGRVSHCSVLFYSSSFFASCPSVIISFISQTRKVCQEKLKRRCWLLCWTFPTVFLKDLIWNWLRRQRDSHIYSF